MTEWVPRLPRLTARLAGVFYLLVILFAPLAVFIRNRLAVFADATATAANILNHERLFRIALATDLVATACYVVVTVLFYTLFKPVNRTLSLLALLFSLIGNAVGAFSLLFDLAPLVVLGGEQYLNVFNIGELRALALMLLKLHGQTVNIGIVFFGFYCLLIGYLIFRSTFLPRILGLGMVFAGLGWLTFLYQPLAHYLIPYNEIAGGVGEGSLTLWLLLMGINTRRWEEQASKSRSTTAVQ